MIELTLTSPLHPDLALLHARHRADMHAETPPESIHMLPPDALAAPEITFYALRKSGEAVAMGAFKDLGDAHAELKSMHVLAEHRGGGLARHLLDALIAAAQAKGFKRLSLETGVETIFAPARGLYARAGFEECGPFGSYRLDPNSCFMTRQI